MSAAALTDAASAVLAQVCAEQESAAAAEVRMLTGVVEWAAMHPPEVTGEAAGFRVSEGSLSRITSSAPLNAPEVPKVAAWAVAEVAAALGLSTDAGRRLVADALELAYRLPGVWRRVESLDVPLWRARQVAQATGSLSGEAVAYVDRHLGAARGAVRMWQVNNLVAEALARFEPERARAEAAADAERRAFDVDLGGTTLGGLTEVRGWLELPDALDLDAAVRDAAAQRSAWGDGEALDVRRARGVGDLAREHLQWSGLDSIGLGAEPPEDDAVVPGSVAARQAERRRVPGRQMTLYVHLSEAAVTGPAAAAGALGRVENTRAPVLQEAVRRWCGSPDARVIVRPVLDLGADVGVDRYEIPDRIAEQVTVRDGACVFPYCGRPARSADLDHIEPYRDRGGGSRGRSAVEPAPQTRPSNLAPLCREHHRYKTRRWWGYARSEDGEYTWTSEVTGRRYLRGARGTVAIDADPRPGNGRRPEPPRGESPP